MTQLLAIVKGIAAWVRGEAKAEAEEQKRRRAEEAQQLEDEKTDAEVARALGGELRERKVLRDRGLDK